MNALEYLSPSGHIRLEWDPANETEVADAKAEFDRLKQAGYVFYSVPVEVREFAEAATGELTVTPADRDEAPAAVEEKPRRRFGGRRKQPEGPVKEFNAKSERTVGVPPMRGG